MLAEPAWYQFWESPYYSDSHRKFRKQVREFELERRREVAAKLAPEKRARATERARQRNEANNAALEAIRRRANGGR